MSELKTEVRLLAYADLCRLGIDYSPTTLWRLWKAGQFPAPLKLGARRNAWRASDIEAWLAAGPATQSPARRSRPMTEHFETRSKKGRGKAQKSLDLIEAMYEAAAAAQPINGRGIGYKLFTAGMIPSMDRPVMQRVYRLLKEAREKGTIPWEWIVDETSRTRAMLKLG